MNYRRLKISKALWRRRLHYRQRRAEHWKRRDKAKRYRHWHALAVLARAKVKRRDAQLRKARPLRIRALEIALKEVGTMEAGGNNMGPILKYIRANGGTPGEPWCGDFDAYCYLKAGAKSVTRAWASVSWLQRILSRVFSPKPGHVVTYEFDHTGLFRRWINKKTGDFEAVEGNTGATGAVSDSKTGNDGVYIKRRNRNQVSSFRKVLR